MATTTIMVRPPRPNLLKRRHVGFAQRHIVVDDEEEAEVRYRHALQRHRQRLTYDRMKIRTVLFLKKNKSLHSVLKSWWRFKRLTSMDKEKQKQTFLTMAVIGHILSRNKRGARLHSGLAKVAALVVIPFATPPLIVLGIPSVVLLLPLWILVWAIVTLNRSAKKVLLQNRRVKGKKSASLTRRLSQFLSFREISKSSSVTTTTTISNSNHSDVRKQAIADNHKRQADADGSDSSSSTSSLRRTSTFDSTTDSTVATSTETTNLTNGTVAEGTPVMETVPKLPTIVESTGNISKRTPRRNASWNVLPRKGWAPKTTLASKSLERRPSMCTN